MERNGRPTGQDGGNGRRRRISLRQNTERGYNYGMEEDRNDKMAGAVDKLYKAAVSKLFFPHINERMKTMVPISAEFTAMVTGHGVTRSYRNRFQIIPNSTCPCGLEEEQSTT